uniref:Uncharacterized protein n=1 Tax=Rhizophora mucronata TaxID=61149 RepID=A0A2P2KL69_RHIMU
MYRTLKTL